MAFPTLFSRHCDLHGAMRRRAARSCRVTVVILYAKTIAHLGRRSLRPGSCDWAPWPILQIASGRDAARREIEQATIAGLLASARSGAGASLALVGEPGAGKSSLLGETARHAAQVMTVVTTSGIESEARSSAMRSRNWSSILDETEDDDVIGAMRDPFTCLRGHRVFLFGDAAHGVQGGGHGLEVVAGHRVGVLLLLG